MLYKSTGTKLLVIYTIEFSTKQSYCLLYFADEFPHSAVGAVVLQSNQFLPDYDIWSPANPSSSF